MLEIVTKHIPGRNDLLRSKIDFGLTEYDSIIDWNSIIQKRVAKQWKALNVNRRGQRTGQNSSMNAFSYIGYNDNLFRVCAICRVHVCVCVC